jgi:hypothetical protein
VVWPQNHSDGLQFGLKTGGDGFPGLDLKTNSSGLVIWDSKSPWRFLGLCLKTMQASVDRLHHETDGGGMAWDTHQDWWRRNGGWCTWHHREGCVGIKLKTDGSM